MLLIEFYVEATVFCFHMISRVLFWFQASEKTLVVDEKQSGPFENLFICNIFSKP